MKCFAPAKINLALDIVKKRSDGYHELCMIMQTISLYDEIETEKSDKTEVWCNKEDIPTDERNLAYKAALEFFKYTGLKGGCKISLKKVIPDGAGLGGGSSDAAEVILSLNKLYETNLSETEMKEIAVKIGADVPFFITKGTCVAKGIGEILTKTENKLKGTVLICKPDFSISTKQSYKNFDISKKKIYNFKEVQKAVESGDILSYKKYKFNVLEDAVAKDYPEIETVKNIMYKSGCDAAMMTGSGSAVFGIFKEKTDAEKAAGDLKNYECFLTNFI